MRNQVGYVAVLIGLMCVIRLSLSAIGYAAPYYRVGSAHPTPLLFTHT